MSQQYDVPNLFNFLLHTPESGLRKMLVEKNFSDVHFNLMLKIVRCCSEAQFQEHFEKQDYPKMKFSPAEQKLREKFWGECMKVWDNRGLLTPAVAVKAA